jgi:hypothetical protein
LSLPALEPKKQALAVQPVAALNNQSNGNTSHDKVVLQKRGARNWPFGWFGAETACWKRKTIAKRCCPKGGHAELDACKSGQGIVRNRQFAQRPTAVSGDANNRFVSARRSHTTSSSGRHWKSSHGGHERALLRLMEAERLWWPRPPKERFDKYKIAFYRVDPTLSRSEYRQLLRKQSTLQPGVRNDTV